MLLLEPNLSCKLLVNQHEIKTIQFYCYSDEPYQIELWTNLSVNKQWIPLSFCDHKLLLDITQLEPNQKYQFTARYRLPNDSEWSWLGQHGENGHVYIIHSNNSISLPSISHSLTFVSNKLLAPSLSLWHFKTPNSSPPILTLSHPIHVYTALIRKGSTWLTPISDYDDFNQHINEQWALFLYQDRLNGHVHLWLAINEASDCWFTPINHDSIQLHHTTEAHVIMVSALSSEPIPSLFQTALDYYYDQKSTPSHALPTRLLDKLGYCTWNAFGQSIDMSQLKSGLESLKSNQIPVDYLLLDDGWQSISNQRQLNGFDTMPSKFPCLKQTISDLKHEFSFLKSIGVWHTLWGYWNGIDHEFATQHNYDWFHSPSHQGDFVGLLKDPSLFYKEFYQHLSQQGVDFVKVDNQGAFQDLQMPFVDLWDQYRTALIRYSDMYFDGHVIHCMSLTPHVLFHPIFSLQQKALFRNSDDFFPEEPNSHSWHVYANAINALLSSYYPVIGDWDMFQSNHSFAEYHAASRALSGGPIYLSDPPNQHNTKLIYRLLAKTRHSGYTLLRSCQPAQPTFHTVFNNPMENSLVSIFNTNTSYHAYGFFNTVDQPQLAVVPLPADSVAYVVSGPDQGCLSSSNEIVSRVDGFGSTVISISPITQFIACLGLVDKFNSTKPILETSIKRFKKLYHYQCRLSHQSESCVFWLRERYDPVKVFLDQHIVSDWSFDHGLLTVNMTSVPLDASKNDSFLIDLFIK